MKEHKKLYKAGKRWLTATILTASSALLLAGATTVSAHASGDGQSSSTTTNQPATQPSGGGTGTITTASQQSLPDIHDGNVTISGPDQNATQRATMQTNVNAAITTAQNDSAAADSARAAVVSAQNDNDAASAAVDASNTYDSEYHSLNSLLTQKQNYFTGQQNSMWQQANELDSQLSTLSHQESSILVHLRRASGADRAKLNSQYLDVSNQYAEVSNRQTQLENDGTKFMHLAAHYNDAQNTFDNDSFAVLRNKSVDNLQKFKNDVNNFITTTSADPDLNLSADDKQQLQKFVQAIDNEISAVRGFTSHGFTDENLWYYDAQHQLKQKKQALNAAVDKATTSAHHETALQNELNALPIVRSATKTVTRTITSNILGSTPVTQTATVTGTATMDADDSAATSYNWTTPGNWAAYTVPDVDGYTHTQKTVLAQAVDGNTADSSVNVTYTELDAHRYGNDVRLAELNKNVNDAVPQPQLLNPVASSSSTNPLFASLIREVPSSYVTLPAGTTARWANPTEVANDMKHAGDYNPEVIVTFPDGSTTTLTEHLHVHNPGGSTTPTNPSSGTHTPGGSTTPTNPSSGTHTPGGTTTPTNPSSGTHTPGGSTTPTNPSSGTHNPGGSTTPTNPSSGTHNPGGTTTPTNPSSSTHNPGGSTTPTSPNNPRQPSSGNHGESGNPSGANPSNPNQPSNPSNNAGVQPGQPSNTQPGNTTSVTPGNNMPTNNTTPGQSAPANQEPTATVNGNGSNGNGATTNVAVNNHNAASTANLTAAQRTALNAARQALSAQKAAQQANSSSKQKLPQTGNHDEGAAVMLGAFGTLLGLGLAADKKRFN